MLFYKERDSGRGIIFLIKQKQRQETEEQEAKKAMIHTLNNDTIAAVSTALTNSGIGIIRISGDRAVETADRIFRKPNGRKLKDEKTFTIHYGHIYDGDQMIDEVLVMLMRGPKSYTAEDTVEIDCHGGVLVMKKVLETVIKNGARPAEPGNSQRGLF